MTPGASTVMTWRAERMFWNIYHSHIWASSWGDSTSRLHYVLWVEQLCGLCMWLEPPSLVAAFKEEILKHKYLLRPWQRLLYLPGLASGVMWPPFHHTPGHSLSRSMVTLVRFQGKRSKSWWPLLKSSHKMWALSIEIRVKVVWLYTGICWLEKHPRQLFSWICARHYSRSRTKDMDGISKIDAYKGWKCSSAIEIYLHAQAWNPG